MNVLSKELQDLLTQKVEDTAGVTPLVVVPRHKLNKVLVQRNTRLSIEDGGVSVAAQIHGNELVLRVGEDA